MSLKLYVIRHGQSDSNLAERFYDDSKADLTTLGKAQAMDVGMRIVDELGRNVDAIYCSTYERAKATCAIALEYARMKSRKKDVVYEDCLVERNLEGLYGEPFNSDHWKALQNFQSDLAEKEGVETLDEMEARVKGFLEEVKSKYSDGTILVFTHGLLELAFYTTIYGRPESGTTYDLRLLKNGEWRIYEIE